MAATAQNVHSQLSEKVQVGYANDAELQMVREREDAHLVAHQYVASVSSNGLVWNHMYTRENEISVTVTEVAASPEWRPDHHMEMNWHPPRDQEFQVVPVDSYRRVERELRAFELENRTQYRHELTEAYRHSAREEAIARHPVLAPMYDVIQSAAQFGQHHLGTTSPHLVAFLERVEDRALDHLADGKQLPTFHHREVPSPQRELPFEGSRARQRNSELDLER